MDQIQKTLLEQIAGLHEVPQGAYNIRENGESAGVYEQNPVWRRRFRRPVPGMGIFRCIELCPESGCELYIRAADRHGGTGNHPDYPAFSHRRRVDDPRLVEQQLY